MMIMENVYKLTKEEVQALKTCDHVSFIYEAERGENKAIIRAIKELKKNVWEREKVIEIETGVELWGKGSENVKRCYYNISGAKYTHWATIAENLKEGDRLVLRWYAANNNKYLNDAGLFADEVYLDVYRESKGKMKTRRFFVGYAVCGNNLARMCQTL